MVSLNPPYNYNSALKIIIRHSGYHFHFITEDKKAGGHLLECQTKNVMIRIDYTSNSFLALPEDEEFYKTKWSKENRAVLEKVEK